MYSVLGLIAVYLTANALGLWWLYRSSQTFAEPTVHNAISIVIRIAVVSVGFVAFCHYVVEMQLGLLLIVSVFVLGWTTLVRINQPPGDRVIEIMVWAALVIPFYFTREFALGFPIRKELILQPEQDTDAIDSYDHLCGQIALVTSPLRPNGIIRLEDSEFNARSDNGSFVDTGTRVIVSDCSGATLVVTQTDNTQS